MPFVCGGVNGPKNTSVQQGNPQTAKLGLNKCHNKDVIRLDKTIFVEGAGESVVAVT